MKGGLESAAWHVIGYDLESRNPIKIEIPEDMGVSCLVLCLFAGDFLIKQPVLALIDDLGRSLSSSSVYRYFYMYVTY